MEAGKFVCRILLLVGFVMALGACHKNTPAPRTAPPPVGASNGSGAPPIVSLTAEPATVERGQSVTLSWTSENATELDLEPQTGKVQATGSVTVTPTESTTYVLTATGPGGTQTASARVTVTGAPPKASARDSAAAPARVSEESIIDRDLKDAYFDLDRSDIRPDAQQTLTRDADVLKTNPNLSVSLEGHCDERGSEEYNLGLGDRRSMAAKNFLLNLGVPPEQITTISYGKDRPQCHEQSEDCWQKNRRVHFAAK